MSGKTCHDTQHPAMEHKSLFELARETRYPAGAYVFIQRGLDFTVRQIHGDPPEDDEVSLDEPDVSRHVSGQQLCDGLRDFANSEYGSLARTVLRRWRIESCEDFGRIVFAMVDAGLMRKTPDDSLEDFRNHYDFDEAFTPAGEVAGG